ncbi:MAG: sigma-54 dependent transcriptional regulator [Myxococcota bacterium]|nr:sigma-54 dependent transcriptional regulator [Myxococcota bacterium]
MSLRVLVVEDQRELRRVIERHLKRRGMEVVCAESVAEARKHLQAQAFHAALVDVWLPDGQGLDALDATPAGVPKPATIVMTGEATVEIAVGALRSGAFDFLLKPFSLEALDAALARVIVGTSPVVAIPAAPEAGAGWRQQHAPEMLGEDPRLLDVFQILSRVADTDCSVVVQGETGTGKELVARAIHAASGRAQHAFVALNCAALPEQLMESELFGHARGAFTGAVEKRVGRFAAADGGTLFLDEIGELPWAVQAKLLRALQEKEITPVGESRPMQVDVRVVAATHRDLEEMAENRQFREDLLYRLDVIRVVMPPLRDRASDVPLLVRHFVERANARRERRVTGVEPDALRAMSAFAWPGNVRQLANVVERMVLMRGEGMIQLADLPERVRAAIPAAPASSASTAPVLPAEGIDLRDALEQLEGSLIRQALERTGGNRNRAAALLRINRTTLVEKLKKRGWTDDEGEAG